VRIQVLTVPYALRAESAASAEVADVAVSALSAADTTSVGGLDAAFVTEIWEHTNLDGSGPGNDDPTEGLTDTDLDGIANFVDPDNDDDGLSDSVEVGQGSDINLVTPVLLTVTPNSSFAQMTQTVSVTGTSFEAGMSVDFGSETPAPANLTPTSFDVDVGPQDFGLADVQVTRLNGETATLVGAYTFLPGLGSHGGVRFGSSRQFSFDVASAGLALSVGSDLYEVDSDGDWTADTTFSFDGSAVNSQLALAYDAADALVGLRCRDGIGGDCHVEVARDMDGDSELDDETGIAVQTIAGGDAQVRAPAIAFDPSGGIAVVYKALISNTDPEVDLQVAHDRNGDGLFTGTNELVTVSTTEVGGRNVGEIAVDASGRVAVVWMASHGTGFAELQAAWDRSGDGDFDDAPGGVPELFLVDNPALPTFTCMGVGFAPDGDLVIVANHSAAAGVRFYRDLNADGDVSDAGEDQVLANVFSVDCDLHGGASSVAVGYVDGNDVRLAVDRNDDGDFDDPGENQVVGTTGADVSRLAVAHDPGGVAHLATAGTANVIYRDPGP
jgi:hypothetical protein